MSLRTESLSQSQTGNPKKVGTLSLHAGGEGPPLSQKHFCGDGEQAPHERCNRTILGLTRTIVALP
jgi:hypothetical protein